MRDGLDDEYCDRLAQLFATVQDAFRRIHLVGTSLRSRRLRPAAGMIATATNPAGLHAATYIDLLSRGFNTAWDRASFEWHVRRPLNGQATDVAVRSNGSMLLAAAAYSYRDLIDRERTNAQGLYHGSGNHPANGTWPWALLGFATSRTRIVPPAWMQRLAGIHYA